MKYIALALLLTGCASTSFNGVRLDRATGVTAITVVGAALILAAEREQDREQESRDKGHPEHGCAACVPEKIVLD